MCCCDGIGDVTVMIPIVAERFFMLLLLPSGLTCIQELCAVTFFD